MKAAPTNSTGRRHGNTGCEVASPMSPARAEAASAGFPTASPASRLKVLHILAALPVGGAETLLLAALTAADQRSFSYLVCSLSDKGPVGKEMEQAGIEVVSLGRMRHKRFDVGIILRLCRLMRHREVDIVHTHIYHASRCLCPGSVYEWMDEKCGVAMNTVAPWRAIRQISAVTAATSLKCSIT